MKPYQFIILCVLIAVVIGETWYNQRKNDDAYKILFAKNELLADSLQNVAKRQIDTVSILQQQIVKNYENNYYDKKLVSGTGTLDSLIILYFKFRPTISDTATRQ